MKKVRNINDIKIISIRLKLFSEQNVNNIIDMSFPICVYGVDSNIMYQCEFLYSGALDV